MIDYKLKGTMLAFSMLVMTTGSILTIDDWKKLNLQQKIEVVEKNTELDKSDKELLKEMMHADADLNKMESVFHNKVMELRLEANSTINPIKKIKFKDAAQAFEKSIQRLKRIRGQENILGGIKRDLANSNHSPELKAGFERSFNRIMLENEKEKKELMLSLAEGFFAIKAAKNSERILQEKKQEIVETSPKIEDVNFFGPITLVIGFLGSIIAGLKLFLDYKKAQIDLKLAELQLNRAQE